MNDFTGKLSGRYSIYFTKQQLPSKYLESSYFHSLNESSSYHLIFLFTRNSLSYFPIAIPGFFSFPRCSDFFLLNFTFQAYFFFFSPGETLRFILKILAIKKQVRIVLQPVILQDCVNTWTQQSKCLLIQPRAVCVTFGCNNRGFLCVGFFGLR